MGLEIDILPPSGPPIFTGKALDIRLPDVQMPVPQKDGTTVMKLQKVRVITFPHWVYKVNINGQIIELMGDDLVAGMPLSFNGDFINIVDIDRIDYHGMELVKLPLGRPPKKDDNIKRQKLSLRFYEDGGQNWVVDES